MKQYRLVIFDFDGTLADTSEGIFNSVRYASEKMKLPRLSEEMMRTFIGPALNDSYNRCFGLTNDSLDKAIRLHKEYSLAKGFKQLRFYDGVFELIDTLRQTGVKCAIATLKLQDTVDKISEEFGCADLFDIRKGAEIGCTMTKADMIRLCMKMAGNIPPENTVMIGDSAFDAIGARDGGVDFIAVTYGFGFSKGDDLSVFNPRAVISSPAELLKCFP